MLKPGISTWGLLCQGLEASHPHWGLGGHETRGISPTLCGGIISPVSGRLGWDPPPPRKETLVAIGWLSGGMLPGPRGIGGNCGVTVRRGQRSLLMLGQPRDSACVQPGLGGGDQQSRPGLGPSVGPSLSCAPGPSGPSHLPTSTSSLWGARGWAIPTSLRVPTWAWGWP